MSELKKATWAVIKALDSFTLTTPLEKSEDVVAHLRTLVQPGVHVGNKNIEGEQIIEWYAGQILDIIDNKAWFAMNSIINCANKFLGPEDKE